MAFFTFFQAYSNMSKLADFSAKMRPKKSILSLRVFMKSRTVSKLLYANHGSTKQLAVEK